MSRDNLYAYYREALQGRPLPLAFVDLDRFDANTKAILARAQETPICVASKSIRCVGLLKRILGASPRFQSIMAYSLREAVFLATQGCDNILVAYPVLSEVAARLSHAPQDAFSFRTIFDALRANRTIRLMVDCEAHVSNLEEYGARESVVVPVCIDLDMSTSFPGLYFGVRRSPVRTGEQALALWRCIQECPHVRLDGVMGYEAQIAGVQDSAPRARLKSAIIRRLKKRSLPQVRARRAAVVKALREAGARLQFVNGGGTGSIESTIEEHNVVTEVTVGSGFYAPGLFDHYARFRHQPAAGFALEITRRPAPNVFTCHGGGYIASGPAGSDRLPSIWLPEGAALLPLEGAGEVQTPVHYEGPEKLELGSPVFLRHAKAGELCERFNTLVLISEGRIVDEIPTYRGNGLAFV
ncbi:MAG: amino acid deaminase/aldolase [Candidatus Hydrogenedentes bacterium]|nr:amino acid deaminase/aldolase [Candidatus Hydrogenedentota bacterium]